MEQNDRVQLYLLEYDYASTQSKPMRPRPNVMYLLSPVMVTYIMHRYLVKFEYTVAKETQPEKSRTVSIIKSVIV